MIDDCPQCGEPTEEFIEGYCPDCKRERQDRLDQHNASYDHWQKLSDSERDAAIKWQLR